MLILGVIVSRVFTLEIEFNEKLAFLFEPARLKIGYGGRGAGKTDGYAIALIVFAMKMRLRILCLREIQNSIEESVKSTIENYIEQFSCQQIKFFYYFLKSK